MADGSDRSAEHDRDVERPDAGDGSDGLDLAAESDCRCHVCGSSIDPTVWHPAATSVDDGGEFHLHVFCSEDCHRSWRNE